MESGPFLALSMKVIASMAPKLAMRKVLMNQQLLGALVVILTLMPLTIPVGSQRGIKVTDPIEKAALLAFRKVLIDNTNALQDWIADTDPCINNWRGVYCDTAHQPANGSNYLHVTELRLFALKLGGTLVPELGNLIALSTLDVMWNSLTGHIPSSLGNLGRLKILALNGNKLTGSIPPELGNLVLMDRIQLDENQLSGPIPKTFVNLVNLAHLHLNNNTLTGLIPPELGQLPKLIHILLDSNQLSGPLPVNIANCTTLTILQLDNNKFSGGIPLDYATNLTSLNKLSCRNCSLSGTIPDLDNLAHLRFLDLSNNNLNGTIPNMDTTNMTTIDLSYNELTGEIPRFLLGAGNLQKLKLGNNQLGGSIPNFAAQMDYTNTAQLLDFQNNSFDYVNLGLVSDAVHQPNLHLWLSGNSEICDGSGFIVELSRLCKPVFGEQLQSWGKPNDLPTGGPILVTYRLKSPGFSYFTHNYTLAFRHYIASGLNIDYNQVLIQSFKWQPGPRLLILIIINPPPNTMFNSTEIERIETAFANWDVKNSTFYGPYELLGFELVGRGKSGLRKGVLAGIIIGAFALLFTLFGLPLFVFKKRGALMTPGQKRTAAHKMSLRAARLSLLKITGVSSFTYKELAKATDDFSESKEVGRGGYGKVYRGVLGSGQVVAIKRANIEAIQRNTEFYNEIELLSRCHHRNLVALVGYCNDEEEQMLVYEFMEGGTLHDHLHDAATTRLNYADRIRIALGAAKGVLYLHTEANPPIFHRDIKSNNILLDEKRQAKVADFGLSRLAPELDDIGGSTASHVSTVVKGTPGYLDPEYFLTRKLTDKSDVYSFGVVLLELITGMQPISQGKNIVREVLSLYEAGNLLATVDTRMGAYPAESVMEVARLAISCVKSDTDSRPTMARVTRSLEEMAKELRDSGNLDISKDDYSLHSFKDRAVGPANGFNSSSSHQPVSTSNYISVQGNDYLTPR